MPHVQLLPSDRSHVCPVIEKEAQLTVTNAKLIYPSSCYLTGTVVADKPFLLNSNVTSKY
jgi:hypothetical protein